MEGVRDGGKESDAVESAPIKGAPATLPLAEKRAGGGRAPTASSECLRRGRVEDVVPNGCGEENELNDRLRFAFPFTAVEGVRPPPFRIPTGGVSMECRRFVVECATVLRFFFCFFRMGRGNWEVVISTSLTFFSSSSSPSSSSSSSSSSPPSSSPSWNFTRGLLDSKWSGAGLPIRCFFPSSFSAESESRTAVEEPEKTAVSFRSKCTKGGPGGGEADALGVPHAASTCGGASSNSNGCGGFLSVRFSASCRERSELLVENEEEVEEVAGMWRDNGILPSSAWGALSTVVLLGFWLVLAPTLLRRTAGFGSSAAGWSWWLRRMLLLRMGALRWVLKGRGGVVPVAEGSCAVVGELSATDNGEADDP